MDDWARFAPSKVASVSAQKLDAVLAELAKTRVERRLPIGLKLDKRPLMKQKELAKYPTLPDRFVKFDDVVGASESKFAQELQTKVTVNLSPEEASTGTTARLRSELLQHLRAFDWPEAASACLNLACKSYYFDLSDRRRARLHGVVETVYLGRVEGVLAQYEQEEGKRNAAGIFGKDVNAARAFVRMLCDVGRKYSPLRIESILAQAVQEAMVADGLTTPKKGRDESGGAGGLDAATGTVLAESVAVTAAAASAAAALSGEECERSYWKGPPGHAVTGVTEEGTGQEIEHDGVGAETRGELSQSHDTGGGDGSLSIPAGGETTVFWSRRGGPRLAGEGRAYADPALMKRIHAAERGGQPTAEQLGSNLEAVIVRNEVNLIDSCAEAAIAGSAVRRDRFGREQPLDAGKPYALARVSPYEIAPQQPGLAHPLLAPAPRKRVALTAPNQTQAHTSAAAGRVRVHPHPQFLDSLATSSAQSGMGVSAGLDGVGASTMYGMVGQLLMQHGDAGSRPRGAQEEEGIARSPAGIREKVAAQTRACAGGKPPPVSLASLSARVNVAASQLSFAQRRCRGAGSNQADLDPAAHPAHEYLLSLGTVQAGDHAEALEKAQAVSTPRSPRSLPVAGGGGSTARVGRTMGGRAGQLDLSLASTFSGEGGGLGLGHDPSAMPSSPSPSPPARPVTVSTSWPSGTPGIISNVSVSQRQRQGPGTVSHTQGVVVTVALSAGLTTGGDDVQASVPRLAGDSGQEHVYRSGSVFNSPVTPFLPILSQWQGQGGLSRIEGTPHRAARGAPASIEGSDFSSAAVHSRPHSGLAGMALPPEQPLPPGPRPVVPAALFKSSTVVHALFTAAEPLPAVDSTDVDARKKRQAASSGQGRPPTPDHPRGSKGARGAAVHEGGRVKWWHKQGYAPASMERGGGATGGAFQPDRTSAAALLGPAAASLLSTRTAGRVVNSEGLILTRMGIGTGQEGPTGCGMESEEAERMRAARAQVAAWALLPSGSSATVRLAAAHSAGSNSADGDGGGGGDTLMPWQLPDGPTASELAALQSRGWHPKVMASLNRLSDAVRLSAALPVPTSTRTLGLGAATAARPVPISLTPLRVHAPLPLNKRNSAMAAYVRQRMESEWASRQAGKVAREADRERGGGEEGGGGRG